MPNETRVSVEHPSGTNGNGNKNGNGHQKVTRTTVFLTEGLNFYIDVYVMQTGEPKGKVIREAIACYLESKGFSDVENRPSRFEINFSGGSAT
jgi:hypothetical protein